MHSPQPEPARPITRAQIHKQVWRIAWPSVITFSLMTTNSILDRWFVGKLGPNALAAVGVGGQVLFILVSVSMAISVGTTALVARFTGAREPGDVDRAAGQSLALGAGAGVILTLGLYLGLDGLLSAMGVGEQANIECRRFLHIALLGTVPMVLVNVIASAFRGLGDTRTPMKVMVCANLVHIMGDYCFMLGGLGARRLGLAGGGVAVASSNLTAYIVYTWLLARSPLRGALRPASLRLSIAWAARILRIGWPAALTALLRNTSLMAFTGILARTAEKTLAVAALPIGLAAESLAFMPGFGFSVAASALVGQSLGARDPDRAQAAGWAAAQQGAVIMSIMGAVFFVAAEPFTRMFTHDPVVVRISISYLRIMAISEPALAFGMILTGGLQGAGDTLRPTLLTACSFWLFRIPLAWFLALHLNMHATGAWIAMSASTILGGAATMLLFKNDRWKRTRV